MRHATARVVTLALAAVLAAAAPTWADGPIPGGFKIGVVSATLAGGPSPSGLPQFDARRRIAYGAFLSVPLGERLGIQPEVLIHPRGGHGPGTISGTPVDLRMRLGYVQIPVLVTYTGGGRTRLRVLAGPALAVSTGATVEVAVGGNVVQSSTLDSSVRDVELGAVVGLGIEFDRGSYATFGELRYDHGFTDVFEDSLDAGAGYRNRSLMLAIGIRIF